MLQLFGKTKAWKAEYDDTLYKIYDWDGHLAGYLFPHYGDNIDTEGENDEVIEEMNKVHTEVPEATLLLPMDRVTVPAVYADAPSLIPLERLSHYLAERTLEAVYAGVAALVLLIRHAPRGVRLIAVVAVASTILGWGVAQWPYILPESLTFSAAAAPAGTLGTVLVVVVLAALIVVPGFVLLFVLDQKGLLPEEGADDEPAAPHDVRGGRG